MDKQAFKTMVENATPEELNWMAETIHNKTVQNQIDNVTHSDDGRLGIYVDGSYNSKTEEYAYGVAIMLDDVIFMKRAFPKSDASSMHNVAGEIEAAKVAIDFAVSHNIKACCIYYDYEGIEKWATGQWKTNNPHTKAYKAYFEANKDKCDFIFQHVKGHTGVIQNEWCDALAKSALGIPTPKKFDAVIKKSINTTPVKDDIPTEVDGPFDTDIPSDRDLPF